MIDLSKIDLNKPVVESALTVNLTKGANVAIDPEVTLVAAGLGWDPQSGAGDFDADVSLVMVGEDGKAVDFVYFNSKTSKDGSVVHTGDNLTGEGEGDDETIIVELEEVDPSVVKIAVLVNIYEAANRGQNFGMVDECYVRLYNTETNEALVKYDLAEDYSVETAVVAGEFYKKNNVWKFKALGTGFETNAAMLEAYGINA